jgi:F5/8 type C domain-containing protein/parallel beta helix pectate lyase-like protein
MAELNVLAVHPDADINNDGRVNVEDFAALAVWWDDENACSSPGWCGGADFDMNGTIDMLDLTYFVENWLRRADWIEEKRIEHGSAAGGRIGTDKEERREEHKTDGAIYHTLLDSCLRRNDKKRTKKMKKTLVLAIVAGMLLSLTGAAMAESYGWYFSQSGNDVTGDGSTDNPWKTLSKAKTQIDAADSSDMVNLYFKRGDTWTKDTGATVTTITFGLLVNSSNPIVNIDAYGSGNKPCFDGLVTDFSTASEHNQSTGPLLWSNMFNFEKENCSIKNIEIKQVYGNAISIKNADGFVLEGCKIHHFGSAGIAGNINTIIDNITIINNIFHTGQQLWLYELRSGWGGAISLITANYQPNNNLVRYNIVYDIYGEGINAPNSIVEYNIVGDTYSIGINTSSHRWDSATTIIRYNLVTSADWDSSVYSGGPGIRIFDERDGGDNTSATIEIYGNTVINRGYGIWIFADRNEPYGTLKVYNNTIIDCHTANMRISSTDEVAIAAYIYNNSSIIYDQTGVDPYQGAQASDFSTFTIENNHAWITGGLVSTDINFRFRTDLCIGDPRLPGEPSIDWDGQSGPTYYKDINFNDIYPSADSPLINAGKTLDAGYNNIFLTEGTDFGALPDTIEFVQATQPDDNWGIGAIVNSEIAGTTYTINNSTVTQTTGFTPSGTLAGGDTLIIPSDWTNHLYFLDVVGADGSPITITNPYDAKISITETMTAAPWGSISFARCRYMVLDGSNYSSETYGIYVENGHFGIRLYESEDLEIKYVEVTSVGIQWQDGAWDAAEDVENLQLHHCYIHDVSGEGIYFGNSSFAPAIYPSFKDCKIYSNIIEDCGWDCIQLGAADQGTNEIYKNYCKNCGTDDVQGQNFGIIMNPYSKGDIYQNTVINAYLSGIRISASCGTINLHDNVVVDSGTYGISSTSNAYHTIINNTVVNRNTDVVDKQGIITKTDGENGEIRYNFVVGSGKAGQISTSYPVNQDNLTSNSIADMYFENVDAENFRLTLSSPARDYSNNAGYSLIDYDGNARPFGTMADAGAFEFMGIAQFLIDQTEWRLLWVDSEETGDEDGRAINSFDGDPNTIWHTEWSLTDPDPCHPHEIQIDLGGFYDVCGFRQLPRQGEWPNGMIKDYEFYVSGDSDNWGTAVASGTFANDQTEKQVSFDRKLGRRVRLVAISEVNDNSWTTMAELNVLAVQPDSDINDDGKVNLEDFAILAVWWDDENACPTTDWCGGSDFNMSGTVDMSDLTYFVENWLR